MRLKIRTSPSDLEAVRWFRRSENASLEELISRLRREEVEMPKKVLAGSALHKCLEEWPELEGEARTMQCNGFTFHISSGIGPLYLPRLREIKMEKVYTIDDMEITVAQVADALDAETVFDHKLSAKFDPESYYLDSLQWRIYLDSFECRRFVYNVFLGKAKRGTDENEWDIYDLNKLELYAYPRMHNDILDALEDFVEIAKVHVPERVEYL